MLSMAYRVIKAGPEFNALLLAAVVRHKARAVLTAEQQTKLANVADKP